jgi:hypothetical protein
MDFLDFSLIFAYFRLFSLIFASLNIRFNVLNRSIMKSAANRSEKPEHIEECNKIKQGTNDSRTFFYWDNLRTLKKLRKQEG